MNAHKYLVNAHKEYYNTQQLETQRNCKYTNIIMKLEKKRSIATYNHKCKLNSD